MIYHITEKSVWLAAQTAGSYEPESLISSGYVHCVDEELFEKVANFYFRGMTNLLVLEIDEGRLEANVKWESVEEHKFPHVYGPVNIDAVIRVAPLAAKSDGTFEFPFKPVLH